MAFNIVENDFRNGQIDEQLEFRTDLGIYGTSAHLLKNVVPFRAGGLTLREGTTVLRDDIKAERVIEFCHSSKESYYIFLALVPDVEPNTFKNTKLYICREGQEDITFNGPWKTTEEINEIHYVQDYEKLILVQGNYPPYVLTRHEASDALGNAVISFSFSQIVMFTHSDEKKLVVDDEGNPELDKDGNYIEVDVPYQYDGLFTERDFPSTVTYAAERLIFANSKEHPYRIWVSAPFPYKFEKLIGDNREQQFGFDFQTERYYEVVDETVSAEQYLQAIEGNTSRVEDLGNGTERRIKKTVSAVGYVIITTGIYDQSSGSLIGTEDVKSFYYNRPSKKWDPVITDDCGMILDIASNRDERIAWLAYVGQNILVGTSSSEWAMPSHLTPTTATIYKVASYGSMEHGACRNGANNMFYIQSGGFQIRGIMDGGQNGTQFFEPSFQSEEMIRQGGGVKEMHWQRVPTPRLYCILNDGSIAVLSYDSNYGINGWTRWTTKGKFKSMAIVDSEMGQDVFVLTERRMVVEGAEVVKTSLEKFTKGVYTDYDGAYPIEGRIITNNIDSPSTIKYLKKIYSISACAGGTRFYANQEGLTPTSARNYDNRLVEIPNWTQPTKQGLRIQIDSYPREPFTIYALIMTVEVGN